MGKRNKKMMIALCVLTLLMLGVTETNAYLMARASQVRRTMTAGRCVLQIEKSGTSVSVRNTGNVPCYVRASVNVCGAENDGKVNFSGLPGSGWTGSYAAGNGGLYGYYYYTSPLSPNSKSTVLFSSATAAGAALSNVCVYAESVQAEGFNTFQAAWSR